MLPPTGYVEYLPPAVQYLHWLYAIHELPPTVHLPITQTHPVHPIQLNLTQHGVRRYELTMIIQITLE
jgi:hypothetical protein